MKEKDENVKVEQTEKITEKAAEKKEAVKKDTGNAEQSVTDAEKKETGKKTNRNSGRRNNRRRDNTKKDAQVADSTNAETVKEEKRQNRPNRNQKTENQKQDTSNQDKQKQNSQRSGAPKRAAKKNQGNKVEVVTGEVIQDAGTKKGLKIIPLGGLEQIGMNITAFEYDDSIIVVDCGISFPDDEMLGIDLVIPDVTYLKDNIEKVKGFVITHGHEDHIGALPYVLKEVNVPVYATKLTVGIIENKLKEHNLLKSTKRKVIKYGQSINLGCFRIEFIRTNHSIADATALAIFSPAGIVIHTGDFKIDYTPVFGQTIDLQRFGELGKKGVLALLADSTNVEKPGFTMSERTVGAAFDTIFNENKNHRIIIATFASNIDRVQQIINSAVKFGRKVCLEGRSLLNIMSTASELGYVTVPENVLIETEQMKNYTDDQLVLITTGSQGEAMAALSRIAAATHKKVSIKPGDTVIFSSHPIPGNEKSVNKVINELYRQGANVIYQDTHVSGHACQEELKLIYALTKPKYAIPVHGEFKHLMKHAELAQRLGISKENVKVLSSGDVLELSEDKFQVVGKVQTGGIFVDGLGVGDVGNIVLRDRQHLSENGLLIVVLTLEKYSNQLLAGPDIVSRGFVYVRESENLMDEARVVVNNALDKCYDKNITDWGKIKNEIKDSLSEYLWKKTKRNPMILPIIMEV